jgi:outer membrane protein OmpA-like peptidoglycan-associated protein
MKKLLPSIVVVLTLGTAQSSVTDRLGRYDFSYSAAGESRVRPIQVFDDGQNTYFQFRPGEAVPAIFAMTPQGPLFASPSIEGPYVKVTLIAKSFQLRMGSLAGRVVHASFVPGESIPDHSPNRNIEQAVDAGTSITARARAAQIVVASAPGASMPTIHQPAAPARIDLQTNSYATPLAGDRVQWTTSETQRSVDVPFTPGSSVLSKEAQANLRSMVPGLQDAGRIEIEGFDDETFKEGVGRARAEAVTRLLLANGIERSKVTFRTSNASALGIGTRGRLVAGVRIASYHSRTLAVAPTGVAPSTQQTGAAANHGVRSWSITAADGTLEQALNRWAREAGWSVINKGAPTVQVVGSTQLQPSDFIKAADVVITLARRAGHPIEATAYANNILVISKKESQ